MRPGDVVWVELAPARGREQSGRRPAVVVSSLDHLQAATSLITVLPATSRDRGWPNHVALEGPVELAGVTLAMTEQVRTIARERVVGSAGSVNSDCLADITAWVRRWLV